MEIAYYWEVCMSWIDIELNTLELLFYEYRYLEVNSLKDIEQFIYSEGNEHYFTSDDYLELISINYHNKDAEINVMRIITKYVDFGKFETLKLVEVLKNALKNDCNLGAYLIDIYELYCDGYIFLRRIALDYGLKCTYTPKGYSEELWYNLSDDEKIRLHKSFHPDLEEYLLKCINWLETGIVKPTGEKNEIDHWEYIDSRKDSELDKIYEN